MRPGGWERGNSTTSSLSLSFSLSPSLSTHARVRNRRMWPSAHFARLCTFAVVTACTFMPAECCPVQRVHAGHDGMALRHASCRTTGGSGSGSEGRLHVHLFWVDCAPTSHIFFAQGSPPLSLSIPSRRWFSIMPV